MLDGRTSLMRAKMCSTKTCNTSGQSLVGGVLRIRYAGRRGVDGREAAKIAGKQGMGSAQHWMPTSPFQEAKPERPPVDYSTTSARQANWAPMHSAPGRTSGSSVRRRLMPAMNWHGAHAASNGSASVAYPSTPMHWSPRNEHGTDDCDRPLSLRARI
jgi:hypothetical protein